MPAAWLLQAQNRQRCSICGLSVSVRCGVHPTCRPEARLAEGPPPVAGDAGHVGEWTGQTFEDIQKANTPTLRHVPAAARHAWSQARARALAAAGHHNTEHAWRELLMLPHCVLCAPPSGGRKHRRAVAAYTRDRRQRWLDGERRGLWESRHVPAARSVRKHCADERRAFATALAREGYKHRACAALLSEGLSPQTATTAEALRALHPQQPLPPAPNIEAEAVRRALRVFPLALRPGRVAFVCSISWTPAPRQAPMAFWNTLLWLSTSWRRAGLVRLLLHAWQEQHW